MLSQVPTPSAVVTTTIPSMYDEALLQHLQQMTGHKIILKTKETVQSGLSDSRSICPAAHVSHLKAIGAAPYTPLKQAARMRLQRNLSNAHKIHGSVPSEPHLNHSTTCRSAASSASTSPSRFCTTLRMSGEASPEASCTLTDIKTNMLSPPRDKAMDDLVTACDGRKSVSLNGDKCAILSHQIDESTAAIKLETDVIVFLDQTLKQDMQVNAENAAAQSPWDLRTTVKKQIKSSKSNQLQP